MLCAAAVQVFAANPKYVFLFIGDGMSVPQRMTAEEFSRAAGTGPLAMNAMPYTATTRTCSFDSLVTDSAAAATAIACGEKTKNHYSGVDPEGRPLYSSALAAKKDPSLAAPDLQRRLKNIFMGVSRNGKTVCHGMLPGAFFGFKRGRDFECKGGSLGGLRRRRLGVDKAMTWDEYDEEVARNGSLLNACSTDLSAFRDRGGKLIVLCGWEDQTTPSPETVAWYEMLAERNGGYDKTGAFCRLFALPGHAHGGGKGRISTAGGYTIKHLDLLRKWVEEGKAPETYPQLWREMNLTIPNPPYPFMCYQDESGNWKTKRYPEGMVRHPDPAYMP